MKRDAEKRGRELYEKMKFLESRGWDEAYPWRFSHPQKGSFYTVEEAYSLEVGEHGGQDER